MSCANDEIGEIVEFGRLAIDDDELRAVALRHQRKSRRRPHHQRRADREIEIGRHRQRFGVTHRRFRHRLAERDRRGLDIAVAFDAFGRAAGLIEALLHPFEFVALAAIETGGVARVAVQFDRRRQPQSPRPDADCRCSASPRRAFCPPCKGSPARDGPGRAGPATKSRPWRSGGASFRRALPGSDRNWSNGIGGCLVQSPPGERKSGIPHSVEMPAPVKATTVRARSMQSSNASTAFSMSAVIMYAAWHRR